MILYSKVLNLFQKEFKYNTSAVEASPHNSTATVIHVEKEECFEDHGIKEAESILLHGTNKRSIISNVSHSSNLSLINITSTTNEDIDEFKAIKHNVHPLESAERHK